jgi:hypothetical protein
MEIRYAPSNFVETILEGNRDFAELIAYKRSQASPPIGAPTQGWLDWTCDAGVRIYLRAGKRIRPQPMTGGTLHRNETALAADDRDMVTLDYAGVQRLPIIGAHTLCSCVNPTDPLILLWTRAIVNLASMFHA